LLRSGVLFFCAPWVIECQATMSADPSRIRLSNSGHRFGVALLAVALLVACGPGAALAAEQSVPPRTPPANRLIDSNDPYLLLHARNPVDWYPWGPEALAKAKRENKPIFLSVGYSTCFWCHVAEETIYSKQEFADLMNAWFVNIKVDREQRPDIDRLYMAATQAMTGRGGWPNNVFLTPDLKPFFAGSYFPPHDDAFGRPGFDSIIKSIHKSWTQDPQRVREAAEKTTAALREQLQAPEASEPIDPRASLEQSVAVWVKRADRERGGFGPAKGPRYRAIAIAVADYLIRKMMAPEGGFYTAEDAAVDGKEGLSYLWSRREIVAVLGDQGAQHFLDVYELAPMPDQEKLQTSEQALKGEVL